MSGYTFDYFVGHLLCPYCQHVSEATDETMMTTKLATETDSLFLGVGSKIDIYHPVEDCRYICISKPENPNTFSLIEQWYCPECGIGSAAMVSINDSVITSIKAVALTEEFIRSANYITCDFSFLGWDIDMKANVIKYVGFGDK